MNRIDTIEDFAFLNYNFEELQEENARQQEKIGDLELDVSGLQEEISLLQQDINDLENRLQQDITDVENRLDARMNSLESCAG
jgi:peptidoglycan hydrolase CwlO-like protein